MKINTTIDKVTDDTFGEFFVIAHFKDSYTEDCKELESIGKGMYNGWLICKPNTQHTFALPKSFCSYVTLYPKNKTFTKNISTEILSLLI